MNRVTAFYSYPPISMAEREPLPWNADGDTDIPGEEEATVTPQKHPPLPSGVPVIPYTSSGGREHPDPDGEYCAIPNSDETYSYQGKIWSPRGEWPYKNQERAAEAANNPLEGLDIATLKKVRDLINQLLAQQEGK